MSRSVWSSLFGGWGSGEKERFSVEELTRLHGVLLRNQVVTDNNRNVVVEALRSIAELIIWGDQHDSSLVEYFLTENLLAHFNQILQQRSNRRGDVATQVLQTLSILIQNVRNQQTVYYLFSNNHINEIVSMRFDFEDDEVLGYYVNLLKAVSLKLNEATVQFFFQQMPGGRFSFPLYTEAVKFMAHRDGMVRAAVRTLALSVFAIPLHPLQRFLAQPPTNGYLSQLATQLAEHCQELDRLLSYWDAASPTGCSGVETCLAEVEDQLAYCNDILCTGAPEIREVLLECLWSSFVGPILLLPLVQRDGSAAAAALPRSPGPGSSPGMASAAGSGAWGTEAGGGTPAWVSRAVERATVGPLCSLYVLERALAALTDPSFLASLLTTLLGGPTASSRPASPISSPTAPNLARSGYPSPTAVASAPPPDAAGSGILASTRSQSGPPTPTAAASPPAVPFKGASPNGQQQPWKLGAAPTAPHPAYRAAFLATLRGASSDPALAGAALRVLAALVRSSAVGEELLEQLGLLPRRRKRQKLLLAALTGGASSFTLSTAASPPGAAAAAEAVPEAGVHASGAQPRLPSPERGHIFYNMRAANGNAEPPCNSPEGCPAMPQPGSPGEGGSSGAEGPAPAALSHPASQRNPGGEGGASGGEQQDGKVAGDASTVQVPVAAAAGTAAEAAAAAAPGQQGEPPPWPAGLERDAAAAAAEGGGPQGRPPPAASLQAPKSDAPTGPAAGSSKGLQAAAGSGVHVELGAGAGNNGGDARFAEVACALLALLGCELLPPLSLLTLGWLLNQLLSLGVAGAQLTPPQAALVRAAVAQAQERVLRQVAGPWCDVLPALVAREWSSTRQALLRSGASGVQAAVHTWMQGVLAQELRWQQQLAVAGEAAGGGGEVGAGDGTVAARLAYLAAHTLVILTQVQTLLVGGEIPAAPPVPLPLTISPEALAAAEIAERSTVRLARWLSCVVAFARGQERRVYFGIEGLPGGAEMEAAVTAASLSTASSGGTSKEGSISGRGSGLGGVSAPAEADPEGLLKFGQAAAAAALEGHAPAVVLADPGRQANMGIVLSVAPLLGAEPRVDTQHARWLHVTVRPGVRVMLALLSASNPGNALLVLERQLVAGHWVLAFPGADRARAAAALVEASSARVRSLHRQLLLPLLGELGGAS